MDDQAPAQQNKELLTGEIVFHYSVNVGIFKVLKKKQAQVILGVIVVIALLGGGYYFVAGRTAAPAQDDQSEDIVEKISPDEIGLTMSANPSKKAIKFAISKLSDIKSIEYQLTYEADSTAQEQSEGGEARVQRGITGESKVTSSSNYESPWLDLGSCSKNVCRYDTGVKSVDLTLKIVKKNGKTYEVDKTLEL